MVDLNEKDRFDVVLEKKFGYKKADERPGRASYIKDGYVQKKEDGKVVKVNVKRIDLGIADDPMHNWYIRAYRSDSVCPYSSRHCSEAIELEEERIFFKKLKKMKLLYSIYQLKERVLTRFRKILRRNQK